MDRNGDPLLRRRAMGLRFVDPETEHSYRRWRDVSATTFARIGYIGSAPSWIGVMVAAYLLDPVAAADAAVWVIGWIVTLLVLTGLTFVPALVRTVMPLAALANCAAGFLIVTVLADVVLLDEVVQSRLGVMTAGLIVVMFFGFAIFRIPPGVAMFAITPYVGFGTYQLWHAAGAGDLNQVEAGALTAAQWIAYTGGLLVCTVIELTTRRSFIKDQIIEAQRAMLQRSRETIRRYVPGAVADHIESGDIAGIDVPVRRRVTVVFTDLVGFTSLADRVEAETLTQVVNDYMTSMSEIVAAHGGTVNEFAGDGLMAIFGAPDEMEPEEQAVSAVRAAQEMQARMPELNRRWRGLGVARDLAMRVGINTGVLSVGSFGSPGRMTYTAIGLQTNIAARLQTICDPGEILLSDFTHYLVKDRVTCVPQGEVTCRGVHFPIRVYAPQADLLDGRAADAELRV
jgi:class 3 adenylate cyclase